MAHGLLADLSRDPFPTGFHCWQDATLERDDGGTHFGFVHHGRPLLECDAGNFQLRPGMYFAVPDRMAIRGGDHGPGRGILITRLGYRGFFHLGGPIEPTGRLRYIDGCTDSVLIAPVRKGDPCLNLLHIPPSVCQTAHTHPSHRIGLIVDGAGRCVTAHGSTPLRPGFAFVIPSDEIHHFVTAEQPLRVLAYHPDSDFGPTHDDHPMINRTLVAGQAAAGFEAGS